MKKKILLFIVILALGINFNAYAEVQPSFQGVYPFGPGNAYYTISTKNNAKITINTVFEDPVFTTTVYLSQMDDVVISFFDSKGNPTAVGPVNISQIVAGKKRANAGQETGTSVDFTCNPVTDYTTFSFGLSNIPGANQIEQQNLPPQSGTFQQKIIVVEGPPPALTPIAASVAAPVVPAGKQQVSPVIVTTGGSSIPVSPALPSSPSIPGMAQ